jgi:putative endonuclease
VSGWDYWGFTEYQSVDIAIQREKRLKEWPRKWKLHLVEKNNPYWNDLYELLEGS